MEVERLQPYDPESNRAAARIADRVFLCLLVFSTAVVIALVISLSLSIPGLLIDPWPTVRVASLSLSLSSTPSAAASVVSGNWSVALLVNNHKGRDGFGWDHAQVMLFYRDEFVAGTFLQRFIVAPRRNVTLETGVVIFSHEVGDLAARAMATDSKDSGVMELELWLLNVVRGRRGRLEWDRYYCRGLKVGFSSQNQSQVGSLLSGSTHECV